MTLSLPRIGLIGGSGLYTLPALVKMGEVALETPFGEPSDSYVLGEIGGRPVAFLARHGRGHTLLPSEVNSRANIWGFKKLGCDVLIGVSACGSMKEEYHPGHIVLPDQFIDRTVHRPATFFGEGCVAHVSAAHPVCPVIQAALFSCASESGAPVHNGGTYLSMEGPQFSTRAESLLYRSWGVDVIGMTNIQEARLCREAELCYSTMTMVTDYDCWNEDEQAVTVDAVIAVLKHNAELANEILTRAVQRIPPERSCSCREALKFAILTRPGVVPRETREKLALFLDKYWN